MSRISKEMIIVLMIFGLLISLFLIGRFVYLRKDCCICGSTYSLNDFSPIKSIIYPTLYDCCACKGLNSECCFHSEDKKIGCCNP